MTERTAGAVRRDTGTKKDFIGVDVADAGQYALIEQEALHGRLASFQFASEGPAAGQIGQSIGAEQRQGGIGQLLRSEHRHEAEGARINETNLMVRRPNHDIGVVVFGVPRLRHLHASRHAEMGDPREVTLQIKQQELALPAQRFHSSTPEPVGEISIAWLAPQHARSSRLGFDYSLAGQIGLQASPGGLDFG